LVNDFLAKNKIDKSEIDLVAFHGHTILHIPEKKITWQIGNGHLLASKIGINVVADFRTKDVALGGQGAPLVPIYHFYLLAKQKHPLAVLNIGGISNITYIGDNDENSIEAFDLCFGNAPLDDLIKKQTGRDFDEDGKLTATGQVDVALAEKILANPIFNRKPPKSFDRDDFAAILPLVNELKIENALATLAFIHARAIQMNLDFFSKKPEKIFVCGGGRKNMALMHEMKKLMPKITIQPIEEIGLNGDAIEAEAFAFLGIRSFLKLPISFQNTTGLKFLNSAHGGVLYQK
jgi:anhydro-N-acetylmuramic acid kinase